MPRASRMQRVVVALLLLLPLFWAAHSYRFKTELDTIAQHAGQRLALLSASLDAELLRFESLPAVLAQHPQLRAMLASPNDAESVERTNRLLEAVNDRTGAAMLYLIAPGGNTLAASN
ncbi:MAG: sensor histidine kinase, partial [Betaproteobacteria bacterium HGW-Betaproteobacteria-21]